VKLYADRRGRTFAQILGDLSAVAWTILWVRLAWIVHDSVLTLGAPGRGLEDAGGGLERSLRSAAETASRVPLVGDELRSPLEAAAGAGRTLAQAGRDQQQVVADVATTLAVVTLVLPLTLVLWWLVRRLRWVREATAARRLLDRDPDASLLALRALARQPLSRLGALAADPAAGWRNGDPDTVAALAELELARLGVRRRGPSPR
jgi:hypothetical protein